MGKPVNKAKKFRFELLANWISTHHNPCRVADIGGGKGLLSYLLIQHGFTAVVIDPYYQTLPSKFMDLNKKRYKFDKSELKDIKRVSQTFEEHMAKDFDLLVGLHAHGSNMKVINAAKKYMCKFVLLLCCVVDEPVIPKPDIDWLDSLVEHAITQGFDVKFDSINFKGQNRMIYTN